MTPAARDWRERMIAQWGEQIAVMRRIACGRTAILARAGGLESVVERLRAEIAVAPAPPAGSEPPEPPVPPVPPAPPARPSAAVARDYGRFQEEAEAAEAADRLWFLASKRNGMIMSAAVCRRSGDHETAARYERRADEADWCASGRIKANDAAPLPMRPPPIAVPFAAGPQLDMFA